MFLVRDRQVELGILGHGMCVIHSLLMLMLSSKLGECGTAGAHPKNGVW